MPLRQVALDLKLGRCKKWRAWRRWRRHAALLLGEDATARGGIFRRNSPQVVGVLAMWRHRLALHWLYLEFSMVLIENGVDTVKSRWAGAPLNAAVSC